MAKSMSKKTLLREIEIFSYRLCTCIRQDASWYFNYGYLGALKMCAREMNLDYSQAEDHGAARANAFLKEMAEKNAMSQLIFEERGA